MNDREDRPTTSDRPANFGDPPEQPRVSPAPGGPPADPAGEPLQPSAPAPAPPASAGAPREPEEARWEDVVDPQVTVAAGEPADEWPEPGRVSRGAPGRRPPVPASGSPAREREREDEGDDDEYDEYDEEPVSRWVSLLATIGTALIGIVSVQVLTSLVEGLTLQAGQRVGVPDDLFHRLGYPFGGLGATALVFLVLGVVLVSLPSVLGELLSEGQDRVVGVALVVAIVMGIIIAIGSLLAVRANLHEYAAKNVAVPTYIRVQFTNFLLGSLGAAALALFGSIASMNERSRETYD